MRRVAIALAPLLFLLPLQLLKLLDPVTFQQLTREDGVVESLQFAVYLLGSGFALAIAVRFLRAGERLHAALYLALGLGLGFVALEEIAWGQRLLEFRTPAYFAERNLQRELTIHNLSPIQERLRYVLFAICSYGAFASLLLPSRFRARHAKLLDWIVPDRWLFLYFFPGFVLYLVFGFLRFAGSAPGMAIFAVSNDPRRTFFVWLDQEPVELVLASGFLLFILSRVRRQRRQRSHAERLG